MTFNPSELQSDLLAMLPKYTRIRDCISGADAIKDKTTTYLPKPDPTNETEENDERYNQYIERAQFTEYTGRTVTGMVGMVFAIDQPLLNFPQNMEYLNKNIDGSGISLEQQIKKTISEVSSIGHHGLFVDYSQAGEEVTQADINAGKVRATIDGYLSENIVWVEDKQSGVETVLSLVILKEDYQVPSEDGYKSETETQYRVLIFDEFYYQEIWRTVSENGKSELKLHEQITPLDSNKNVFDHIPFHFVGAVNNDKVRDNPPMLSIADLNIGHYRNSADAEEASFIMGQPTAVFSGLNQSWVDDVMKGTASFGSRGGVLLPEGGSGDLLQAGENIMPERLMDKKELQMAAIGAQLVSDSTKTKTATEINRDSTVDDSVLSTIVGNTEDAYNFCLEQITLFSGIVFDKLVISNDFTIGSFIPQTYTALVSGAMQGYNTKKAVFDYLQSTGMVKENITFEDWDASIIEGIPTFNG